MNLLFLCLAVIFDTSSAPPKPGPEIFVGTDPTVTVEALAKAVSPMGMIESRCRGTRFYLIQLKPGMDDETAKRRLEKIHGVSILTPAEEPVDMNSLRSVNRKIDHMTKSEGGEGKRGTEHDSGVDYLEAYRYMLQQHAFPNDTFDWSSLNRARVHAHQMPVGKLRPMPSIRGTPMASQTWEFVGPTNMAPPQVIDFGIGPVNGRINAVAFDPVTPTTIYAGAAEGGLWKSTDAGATWVWLSSSWTQLAVNCIVIDPTNTQIIYVGRGDYHGRIATSYGIMKTTDGGQSWTEIGLATMGNVGVASLLMDPTNHMTIVAGTGDINTYGQLWTSNDGGKTWNYDIGVEAVNNCTFPSLAASVASNGSVRMYAVVGGFANNLGLLSGGSGYAGRVIYSDDHGNIFNILNCPVVADGSWHDAYSITTSPTNPQNVYVLDSENDKLYTSVDQGNDWKDQSGNLPLGPTMGKTKDYNFSQSWYDYYLGCGNRVVKGKNTDVLYLGQIDIQQSLDQGKTWSTIGGPSWLPQSQGGITHNDQHSFAPCLLNWNLMLFSNDGGIYQLTYNPTTDLNTVTPLNAQLGNTMFYKIACHPTLPQYIMGGTQDNATPYSGGNLLSWLDCGSGDGGGCVINPVNPLISFASAEGFWMVRTDDWWSTSTNISPTVPSSENEAFVAPVVLDPLNPSKLFTGTNDLWTWNDNTHTWTDGEDLCLGQGVINAIAVSPSDDSYVYCGSNEGVLTMASDGGTSFSLIVPPVMATIGTISVNPTDPTDILVGWGGSGIDHLYRCPNTALPGFSVWDDVSGTGLFALPDCMVYALTRDIDDPQNTWYVATDAGVFQTSDAGATWANIGSPYGLPDLSVRDILAVPGTRFLNVGTYGRGWWRLYLAPNNADLNTLTLNPNPVVGGGTSVGKVTLTNPAPSGGAPIVLSTSANILLPSTVTVPAGATSTTFSIPTSYVSSIGTASVTASQQSINLKVNLTILPVLLENVTATPNPVLGGSSTTGEVYLTGNAPKGGMKVTLSSNQSGVKVPASVTVPAGSSTATFSIKTSIVASNLSVTITAKMGSGTELCTLTVQAAALQSVSVSPASVVGGSETVVTGTLAFNGPTPSAGVVVKLSSSNTAVATVPASVTVKLSGSATTATFKITSLKVASSVSVTISAAAAGITKTASLQVNPFEVSEVSFSPGTVIGGSSSTGTVSLNAVPNPKTGTITVALTQADAPITIPSTMKVSADEASGTFTATTTAEPADTQTIVYAALNGSSQQTTLFIKAPTLVEIAVSPTTVKGSSGTSVTGGVEISGPAPSGGIVIALGSNDPSAASVPTSVTIAAGKTTATFKVTHATVKSNVTVTLGASYKGVVKTTSLIVQH